MTFKGIKSFLTSTMKMSQIYQPVMINYLLKQGGKATDREIATEISKYDPTTIEYYQKITNNMVGRVLRNHKVVSKFNDQYFINDFEVLSKQEIDELRIICECELCGISAAEKALEVDHIVPKNRRGEDSINNYQALCYSCNAMKRDTDDTDFRGNINKYDHRIGDCPFCSVKREQIVFENNLAFLIYDKYPVTEYHSLIIPKRHFSDFFETTQPELNAVTYLLENGKNYFQSRDSNIKGFNIGINNGEVAGQTIMHCHIHLMPRRTNDVVDPRGGIRHIILDKGYYVGLIKENKTNIII